MMFPIIVLDPVNSFDGYRDVTVFYLLTTYGRLSTMEYISNNSSLSNTRKKV